ncbi:MAG: hypothetical protein AAGC74_13180, partial [Verrucomicrobiota bacterium]
VDWIGRLVATPRLVLGVLDGMGSDFGCLVLETEYWRGMGLPNVLVEGDVGMVADLVAATSLHAGEVARNPYHLSLPGRMQDAVRRGAELVGGQGGEAPRFAFGELYRLRGWRGGEWEEVVGEGEVVGLGELEEFWGRLLT